MFAKTAMTHNDRDTRSVTDTSPEAMRHGHDPRGAGLITVHVLVLSTHMHSDVRHIYPCLGLELLIKIRALFLQLRFVFPDICEGLSFWVVAGCLSR